MGQGMESGKLQSEDRERAWKAPWSEGILEWKNSWGGLSQPAVALGTPRTMCPPGSKCKNRLLVLS